MRLFAITGLAGASFLTGRAQQSRAEEDEGEVSPAEDLMREHGVLNRILWKAHILHHAGEGPVVGQWMLRELRRHGYDVSPGTLYPLLDRMKGHGWLRCEVNGKGPRARKDYYLTERGREVLQSVRKYVNELHAEMNETES